MLFDSHAHLNDPKYSDDLDSVLARARTAGVGRIVDVGWDKETIPRSRNISERYDWIYSAFGFHPHEASGITEDDLEWLRQELSYDRCVALGEIGLDTVKNYSPIEEQRRVLRSQLELAKSLNKPVLFHSRGGEAEVLDTAVQYGVTRAVFHCFTGAGEIARQIIEKGYFISLAGFVTFARGMPDWISDLPLNKLLLETDCPYLTPVPFRGKRNEPSFIQYTCTTLAAVLGVSEKELEDITTANAMKFYNIH
jgi:TatD DNase family protein